MVKSLILSIAVILSACTHEEQKDDTDMANNLPEDRDETVGPDDPVSSNLANRLQDCAKVGSHRTRPRFLSAYSGHRDIAGTSDADLGYGVTIPAGGQTTWGLEVHSDEIVSSIKTLVYSVTSGATVYADAIVINADGTANGIGSGNQVGPWAAAAINSYVGSFQPSESGPRFLQVSVSVVGTGSASVSGFQIYSSVPID